MNYDFIALGDAGYTGTVNDRVFKYLGDQGYTGSLNDRKFKYYGDLGYNGTLRDRIRQAAVDAGYTSIHNYVYNVGEVYGANPILPLFNNGETGFWYDPSDLTTLFQDSAGTTSVSEVEQPVGLMLDKSQGAQLGAELASDTATAYDTATAFLNLETINGLDTTKMYKGVAVITDYSAGAVKFNTDTTDSGDLTANGTYTWFATGTAVFGLQTRGAGFTGTIQLTIKEVAGQHATQSTSASCPTLSARYNLLEQTEDLDSRSKVGTASVITNTHVAPDGTTTADTLAVPANFDYIQYGSGVAGKIGTEYTGSVYARRDSGTVTIRVQDGDSNPTTKVRIDTSDQTLTELSTTSATVVSTTVEQIDANWDRYSVKVTFSVAPSNVSLMFVNEGGSDTGAVLWGASLVESQYDSLGYQRVGDASTTASDYDSSNSFPKYLKFDGTDDYMVVNGLSASSGPITAHFGYVTDDGESVANQTLADVQTGRALIAAVADVTGQVGYYDTAFTKVDIDTEALTVGTWNLNSTAGQVKVNGTEVITGTGLWTESALGGTTCIGAYFTGASAFLNGNLYSAILRSTTSTDTEIDRAEAYINRKMGGGLL